VPGGQDAPDAGVYQQNQAGRDVYAAGRDQTNINDNRRVELAAGAVPHPAAVDLARPVVGLPRRPVRVFEGRDEALGALARTLGVRGEAVVTQAVYGLGGVGKSELALQYADAHRRDYRLVWWITAADATQVDAGLARLAGRLCPAISVGSRTADAAEWATGWLQAYDGWLLILDNVEDPADVEPLLGQLDRGHVIVTSRRDVDWARLADPVRLDVLDPAAATQVLTLRTGHARTPDEGAVAQIAAELGFLPLALDQGAAYIVAQRITPAAYLDRLRKRPARMHAAASGGAAQRTIARLWDLHIAAIRAQDPIATWLLGVLAQYAPDAIPRVMLVVPEVREEIDEMLGLLASYSMINLTPESVNMHRLLQAVILAQPDDPANAMLSAREAALGLMHAVIPTDHDRNMAGWPLLRALLPHAETLSTHFLPGDKPLKLGWVLGEIASFLRLQGDYTKALSLVQSALAITEAALGPDHPDTVVQLGNLACTHLSLGRAADALSLQERALAITETKLGPDHPTMATTIANLASIYSALGRTVDALPLQERALAITEAPKGPTTPTQPPSWTTSQPPITTCGG
jgi:hypothetical protein